MANYSLTINSKFRPFSYAEMLAPVQAMTQAHQAVEDQYSELMTKASVWENMANEQNDPQAYAMYKSYADALMLAADDLNRNGLTAQSRPQLMALKSGYSSHIAPIEAAYNLRAADIKAQREAEAQKGANMIFTERAATRSLDKYLNGQPLDYESLNLNEVRDTAIAGAQAISKRYFNTYEGKRFSKDYIRLIEANGIAPTDAEGQNQVIQVLRHSGKYPELDKFYNDLKATYRTDRFDNSDQSRIDNAIDMGMNMGLYYSQKETNLEDKEAAFQRQVSLKYLDDQLERGRMALKDRYDHPERYATPEELESEQLANILSWNAPVNYNKGSYEGLLNTLFDKNGKMLDYYTLGTRNGSRIRVNPMALKEEYDKLLGKEEVVYEPHMSGFPSVRRTSGLTPEEARKKITQKYGNVGIISDSAYNKLKALGYTSKTFKNAYRDINRDTLSTKVDELATYYSPSTVNIGNYDHSTDVIIPKLQAHANDKGGGKVAYKYDARTGLVGKEIDSSEFNGDVKIKDIAYSAQAAIQDMKNGEDRHLIIVTYEKDNKSRNAYIDAGAHSAEMDKIVSTFNAAVRQIESDPSMSRTQKNMEISDKQRKATATMRMLLNSYSKVRSESSSKE